LNKVQLAKVQAIANKTQEALDQGNYTGATSLWGEAEDLIENLTDNVDFYNILIHGGAATVSEEKPRGLTGWRRMQYRHLSRLHQASLSALMNGPIRKHLADIPDNVTWGGQAGDVFKYQREDFMKDVISTGEPQCPGISVT